MSKHLMNTYAPLPIAFERGEGAWLWDEDGNRYLDAVAGLAVCALGHAHPDVAKTVAEQSATLVHTSNLFRIAGQERLAERLAAITGADRVFFGNSGAEAIECALKIARLAGHRKGIENPAVVVMNGGFHGRTLAALSASGSRKVQAGFEPLVTGFVRAPFDDIEAIENIASKNGNIVAVMVEPIQGESGVVVPGDQYLSHLRQICNENGWLLILDEIQTGLCRTGRWYAHQHTDIVPDVMTSAKALANGLPIGGCLAWDKAAELMHPGAHGSTFGGNPLCTNTACTVLDVMERDGIANRAAATGATMMDAFRARLGEDPRVREIRGRGLMIGVELEVDAAGVRAECLERGVLVNVTQGRVLRLIPPLIIDSEQAEMIVDAVCAGIECLESE